MAAATTAAARRVFFTYGMEASPLVGCRGYIARKTKRNGVIAIRSVTWGVNRGDYGEGLSGQPEWGSLSGAAWVGSLRRGQDEAVPSRRAVGGSGHHSALASCSR